MTAPIPIFYEPHIRGPRAEFSEWEMPAGGEITMHAGVARPSPELLASAADKPWPVAEPAIDNSGGTWRGPELSCVGGTIELPPQGEDLGNDTYQRGDVILRHDGVSEEIEVHFRFDLGEPLDPALVPIRYEAVAMADGCRVRFDASACPRNDRAIIEASVDGSGVFAPSEMRPLEYLVEDVVIADGVLGGPYLQVEGATVEMLPSTDGRVWSEGIERGRFAITHDGASEQVVVRFATEAPPSSWRRRARRGFVPIRYRPARPGVRMAFDAWQVEHGGRAVVTIRFFGSRGGNMPHLAQLESSQRTDESGAAIIEARLGGRELLCEGGTIDFWPEEAAEAYGQTPWDSFAVTHDGISEEIVITYGTTTG